jgi:relA/spoT domain protein
MNIYGNYEKYLDMILDEFSKRVYKLNDEYKSKTGYKLFEHFISRIKTHESMIEKCKRKDFEVSTHSALKEIKDAIGVRIVCGFVDDIYTLVGLFKDMENINVVEEKDYILNVKPNGYRSYHMILEVITPYPDCDGNENGKYYIEIQLRTIAMDSWASLEHQMKYKKNITNHERITKELKRCADELASCDLNMQTIRKLIEEG